MYAYYLQRGHSLERLLQLSFTEKLFYRNAMELEVERMSAMIGGKNYGKDD